MSHFYGTLQGSRGEATRCGTKRSGIEATAASWDGAIVSEIRWNEDKQRNEYIVCLRPWQGRGVNKVIASGVLGDE